MTKDHPVDGKWEHLALGERIQHLELEGYVVIPRLLDSAHVSLLKAATAKLVTEPADYSSHQQLKFDIQFAGGAITDLIAHPPLVAFLKTLLGPDPVLMTYYFTRCDPGYPGASLHCDGQPWGTATWGYEESCPRFVRVLYYLDDLTSDVSPFRVVPRSHLSMHSDANPYLRYDSHPCQEMVTCAAGSAILLHHGVFHGNYPNTGAHSREMLALTYRPSWAGPDKEVPPWNPADLARVTPEVRALLGDRNTRIWFPDAQNKPAGMRQDAAGIDPRRWELPNS